MADDFNYYRLLQVEETASDEEIRKAYASLVDKYKQEFGDVASYTEEHKRLLDAVEQAYASLSDPKKRAAYDKKRDWKSSASMVYTMKLQNFATYRDTDASSSNVPSIDALRTHSASSGGIARFGSSFSPTMDDDGEVSAQVESAARQRQPQKKKYEQSGQGENAQYYRVLFIFVLVGLLVSGLMLIIGR